MKTRVSTRITCDIDDLCFGWWDEAEEKFIPIKSQDDIKPACAILGCSEKMVDTLIMLVESISETIGADLRDIWERLDKAGI